MLLAAVWLALLARPKRYITALFITAPWVGPFVWIGWELDVFKAGLLLSPLLAIHGLRLRRLRHARWPLLLLLGYALLASSWALLSRETLDYDALKIVPFNPRILAQTALFSLRALLPLLVVSVARQAGDAERWMNAYVWSVFVLCAYGLAQAGAFVAFGTPITPIFRDGLFGSVTEYATVEVWGMELLRVHSFSREPKDLALFCTPALAWLFVRASSPYAARAAREKLRLLVIGVCALLTFASSLLLLIPVMFVLIERLRPSMGLRRGARYWLSVAGVLAALLPPFVVAGQRRVLDRFRDSAGLFQLASLIQPSREGPALEFLKETWPRSALGYGIGTQAFYLPSYMPEEYSRKVQDHRVASGMDSMFLSLAADLGLPGLAAFGLFCWAVLKAARNEPHAVWPARAAFAATLVVGAPLNPSQQGGILWLLAGILCLLGACSRARPQRTDGWIGAGRQFRLMNGPPGDSRRDTGELVTR